jgi:hypothetical protein
MHSKKWFFMQGQSFRPGLSLEVSRSVLIGGKNWMSSKCWWVFFMLLMGAVVMLSQFMVDLSMMQMRQLRSLFFAMKRLTIALPRRWSKAISSIFAEATF